MPVLDMETSTAAVVASAVVFPSNQSLFAEAATAVGIQPSVVAGERVNEVTQRNDYIYILLYSSARLFHDALEIRFSRVLVASTMFDITA